MSPHRGVMILVMGILGLVVCAPVGIAAWIMGNQDLAKMDAGLMDPEGRQLTNVGKILGIVATVLIVLGIVVGVVGVLAAIMGGGGALR